MFLDSALSMKGVYSDSAGVDNHAGAFGGVILQGPMINGNPEDTALFVNINETGFSTQLKMNSKILLATSGHSVYKGAVSPGANKGDSTRFFYLQGLDVFGNPKPNGPFDPGIYGTHPSDQRTLISSGPFTFTPGDTQEVWYAMIGGMGVTKSAARDTVHHYAAMMHQAFRTSMNDYLVGIGEEKHRPKEVSLYPNYPNPFNPSTTIRYELKQPSKVSLKIYNLLGQEVRTLVNQQQLNGIHSAVWDGKNNRGQTVGSGVYFYRLEAGGISVTKKMLLLR